MVEEAPSEVELDEKVDVAFRSGFAPRDGSENADVSGPVRSRYTEDLPSPRGQIRRSGGGTHAPILERGP